MPEITKEKNGRKEQIMSKERRTWEDDVGCLNCESLSAANAELKAENSDLQKQVADLAIECGFKELKEENARLKAGLERAKKLACTMCEISHRCPEIKCTEMQDIEALTPPKELPEGITAMPDEECFKLDDRARELLGQLFEWQRQSEETHWILGKPLGWFEDKIAPPKEQEEPNTHKE
jgi:hypothetical protein